VSVCRFVSAFFVDVTDPDEVTMFAGFINRGVTVANTAQTYDGNIKCHEILLVVFVLLKDKLDGGYIRRCDRFCQGIRWGSTDRNDLALYGGI
jgi:hypothetical protein